MRYTVTKLYGPESAHRCRSISHEISFLQFFAACRFPMIHHLLRSSIFFRNCPVYEASQCATSSGAPSATICPPRNPPFRSQIYYMIRTLDDIKIVFSSQLQYYRFQQVCQGHLSACPHLAKCSPVVGSSSIYIVFPVLLSQSSAAGFILCASPPESCVLR